ncbi:unnamed protein product [Oikopleura dioica]|uniref:UMP-CMP kinase n=2 Tax=Oikopleura dioica TaxID=34765 RepID=E4XWQ9_OIKDI|nr:unnamed protein product [Oikopleura dioica]CBY36831.1 unnamed protein product [Oikopleura dioica]
MGKPKVCFVLGGPGAGKGTACEFLVKKHGLAHLSAGDLLREERKRAGSQFGELIEECIVQGTIVPVEITCQLLENAMNKIMVDSKGEQDKFLIDGFPRNVDNLQGWTKQMDGKTDDRIVLYLNCPLEVCESRIMERSKTSGRSDDNIEALRKRFKTYEESTKGIIEHYRDLGKVREVDSSLTKEEVGETVSRIVEQDLTDVQQPSVSGDH